MTHNTAGSRRMTGADRVHRFSQSRHSSASEDNMGTVYLFSVLSKIIVLFSLIVN